MVSGWVVSQTGKACQWSLSMGEMNEVKPPSRTKGKCGVQAAVCMYERLGYLRAPELDFVPVKGVLIKGYRLDLQRRQ